MGRIGTHAVVLGGSIAGVLAARVLAESYDDVLVIDRDKVLDVRTPRRGAPHARHAHSLHGHGPLIFEELFPNLLDELRADGIPVGDLGEMRWYFNARRLRPTKTGVTSVTAPRPVLEFHIRSRVAALPNVRFLEGFDIVGLTATADRSRVTGVRVQRHGSEGSAEEVIEADLIVDTTGRGSRTSTWLGELGYQRPTEDRVKINLGYTSRLYRLRADEVEGLQSINPVASPAHPRGAFFGQIGPETRILSLTGILGDYPPTEPGQFLEFARSLPIPDIYHVVRDAEPTTTPVSFRFAASVRRRYERLTAFPDGLLVMGDAVSSFNPVYGQGMIVSALESMVLRSLLRQGKEPEPRRFLSKIGSIIDNPWDISAGGDLDFPDVPGRRDAKVRIGNGYVARVAYAATRDPQVTTAYMRVAGLLASPQSLMRPDLAVRVLRHGLRRPEPAPAVLPDDAPTEQKGPLAA